MGARTTKALSRLLNQFSDGDNWIDLMTAIIDRLEDTDIVLSGLLLSRTLDTAEGVWLDNVGVIVGYPRPAEEVADAGVFTLKAAGGADDADKGLSSLGALDGGVLTSLVGLPLTTYVDDATYRKYLYGKVKATYSGSDVASLWEWVNYVFSIDVVIDSPNVGEVTIELPSAFTGQERRIIEKLAPRSAGINLWIKNWP